MQSNKYTKQIYSIAVLLLAIVMGVVMKLLASVMIPVLISILLSFVFYPIVKKLNQKLKMPWVLGTILMVMIFVIIIALLSTIIGTSLSAIVSEYPKYEDRFMSIYKIFASRLNLQIDENLSFFQNMWGQLKVREFLQYTAVSISGNVISLTKSLTLILLLTVFLLIEMKNMREKVCAVFQGKSQLKIMNVAKKVVSDTVNFISIKFFISLATGFIIFVICRIIDMDFAIVWGFLAFVMNFIPTFGSIFSVLLTTLFALVQFYPLLWPTAFILVSTTLVNMILGNIVEPRIEGQNLGLSPFIILVSLLFWGWMWGFVGMVIAVPVMVILKIFCENISFLHPIAIFLGNKVSDTQKSLSNTDKPEINVQEDLIE